MTQELPDLAQQLRLAAASSEMLGAAKAARAALDQVAWDRGVRSQAKAVAARSAWAGALANASFEGAELPAGAAVDVVAGNAPDSPMSRVVIAATDLAGQSARFSQLLASAPLQCLAESATLVGRGFMPAAELGRPRTGPADDPLHLPNLPAAAVVAPALVELGQVLRAADEPAVLVAAVTHAHLALLLPLTWGSGLIARTMIRCTLAARSVDPDMLGVPEVGLVRLGRPRYVRGLAGYSDRSQSGLANWVSVFCGALESGARAAVAD